MEKAKWTPGPFSVNTREFNTKDRGQAASVVGNVDGTPHYLATIWKDGDIGIERGLANANLFAAAPMLYEALLPIEREAVQQEYELTLRHGGRLGIYLTLEELQAVIKASRAAEGQQ